MNIDIQLQLPESIFSTLHKGKDEIATLLKLCTAVKLYELQQLSQERAAELADMTRTEFLLALRDFKISPYQYSFDDAKQEVKAIIGR
ncbi:MAG: UPF0175 family protein [Leptospiraceae bacterium]|nr:UPF0175 family protein [Leptospiraceae bacterium]MCP5493052.1 UPF0175 family protein [Leptospiraceae bacterium]